MLKMSRPKHVVKIDVTNCSPGDVHATAWSGHDYKFRWVNHADFSREISFGDQVPAIFVGLDEAPSFIVPAHGSIELKLSEAPQDSQNPAEYTYSIEADDCIDVIEAGSGSGEPAPRPAPPPPPPPGATPMGGRIIISGP
jgi:hypothetical protein